MVVVQLNMDMIAEILPRLRVKDLIRFKSVCKSWLKLISSRKFIQLHLKMSSVRPIPLPKSKFNIDCCRLPNNGKCEHIFSGSSSDGLVCLFNQGHELSLIHIWNPAIRSSVCIPLMKYPRPIKCFWFGLHGDVYKLLLGTSDFEMLFVRPYISPSYYWSSAQVFNDANCGWCYLDEIGTLFNGNVHWPVGSVGSPHTRVMSTIMSYDLREDMVGKIGVPANKRCVRLGQVDGCLSALLEEDPSRELELWSMKEYGVEESWTKLVVLNMGWFMRTKCLSNSKEVNPFQIDSPVNSKTTYVESLVSPRLGSEMRESCSVIT